MVDADLAGIAAVVVAATLFALAGVQVAELGGEAVGVRLAELLAAFVPLVAFVALISLVALVASAGVGIDALVFDADGAVVALEIDLALRGVDVLAAFAVAGIHGAVAAPIPDAMLALALVGVAEPIPVATEAVRGITLLPATLSGAGADEVAVGVDPGVHAVVAAADCGRHGQDQETTDRTHGHLFYGCVAAVWILNSTRRFLARPDAVALSSTGTSGPKPLAVSRSAVTPFPMR